MTEGMSNSIVVVSLTHFAMATFPVLYVITFAQAHSAALFTACLNELMVDCRHESSREAVVGTWDSEHVQRFLSCRSK